VDVDVVLNTHAGMAPSPEKSAARRARRDIIDGLKSWPVWSALAWHDIRVRYIRTMLGPLWITVSMAAFVFALGLLYSSIFNTDFHNYLPFLTAGLLVWGLVSGILLEAATTFSTAQMIILSVSAPYSLHIYRAVLRQVIIFGHNMLVFIGVMLVVGVPITPATLLFFPALILVCITLAWVNLLVALVGTRFRDLQPIISSVLQLIFFMTPLIWDRGLITGKAHHLLVDANPFYHLIEIVRAPLLGKMPSLLTVAAVIAMAVGGWYVTYLLFARFRRRIPYWL
jgi:lipopolysaccharide transport system permease protein